MSLKPDFVQFLTWNDGGESTYIGNVWDSAIPNSPVYGYKDGFDHLGWSAIIAPFITAYKAGKSSISDIVPPNNAVAAGVFWHRTILTSAACASDALGKPFGWNNAEDVVNVAVMLSASGAGAKVNVYSGGAAIKTMLGVAGLNSWSVPGLKVGVVKVEILPKTGGAAILSASGAMNVAADAKLCNYNYQVVALK